MATPVIHATHDWLLRVKEDIIEPERPIIDPHHHLWQRRRGADYVLEDFWQDTGSGHNIQHSVFIECRTNYYEEGPEHLKPVGETAFVADIARRSRDADGDKTIISGIVLHADLRQRTELEEVLEAHTEVAGKLFKGIRQAGAWQDNGDYLLIQPRGPKGLYLDEDFRRGVRLLGNKGLSYDTWHFHHQNKDFLALAQSAPNTTMILDHFGTPLGVGPYAGRREEIFNEWKKDIAAIARCENVYAKLGGLAMPDNGFGWNLQDVPPTSDEFVAAQRDYYLHTIDCFGPERCMFESNFPVDKWSLSYHVVWNGFKKLAAGFSEAEKSAMFYHTAAKVYRL